MKSPALKANDPSFINPEATLVEASRRMKWLGVEVLSVCAEGKLTGTISLADVTTGAIARGLNPNTVTVRCVMNTNAAYCFDDQNVTEAGKIMEERHVRRLPVINHNQRLLGIISLADLALWARKKRLAGEVLEMMLSTRAVAR